MKGTNQLIQRIKCYAYIDAYAEGISVPTYVLQDVVWGRISPVSARQRYAAAQAGEVVDANVSVVDDAPLSEFGIVADVDAPGELYLVFGITHTPRLERLQASLRRAKRGEYPLSDDPVTQMIVTPPALAVVHGTGSVTGVANVQPQDQYGFAVPNQFVRVVKTAAGSTMVGTVVGYTFNLSNIPNAPASGDVFTFYCTGATPVAVPVTVT